jgi:hypothetical protein
VIHGLRGGSIALRPAGRGATGLGAADNLVDVVLGRGQNGSPASLGC